MKQRSQFIQYILRALLILLPLSGIYVAWVMLRYEIIVRGILGGVLLYLLFYYLKSSETDLSLGEMILAPKIYNHLIYVFIGPLIAFWATKGVFDMILLLINWLSSFLK